MAQLGEIYSQFLIEYKKQTPRKVQIIDCFIVFSFFTGVLQFLYLLLVGQFPYNCFLSGFLSCVGFFIFTVCLRMQVTSSEFSISPERAYADFIVCNAILFFVVMTFMG